MKTTHPLHVGHHNSLRRNSFKFTWDYPSIIRIESQRQSPPSRPCALTIAGSDSSGGAGIQADLRVFAALGVHGTCAITSVTAQGLGGVVSSESLCPEIVGEQIDTVLRTFPIGAIKTGMLATVEIVERVVECIRRSPGVPWVCDPLFRASSGATLLEDSGFDHLRNALHLATLTTPNVSEASRLTGVEIDSMESMRSAGLIFVQRFGGAVLIKGGHAHWNSEAVDVLVTAQGTRELRAARVGQRDVHGTGCALSAAIAARLSHGDALDASIDCAKGILWKGIQNAYSIAGSPHLALALDSPPLV